MRRLALLLAAAFMPFMAAGAEMQAALPGGLHGTFTLPDGEGAVPVALILPGSGPVDRDGNLPGARNDSLKKLAEGLAERGVATLRADKRGIGASRAVGLREEDLRFETYVSDAIAWLGWLSGQKRAGALYLIGHSEGALVATLAAKRQAVSGLVLLAGAGFPAGRVIERQLAGAGLPAPLQEASQRILRTLEAGEKAADVPPQLAPLYRESVQPYLMSWLPLDPAAELKAVLAPVLLVQGTADLQIAPGDFERLREARPDVRTLSIEGMNHVLKAVPPDVSANLAAYNDPAQPLAAALIPAIAGFVHGR